MKTLLWGRGVGIAERDQGEISRIVWKLKTEQNLEFQRFTYNQKNSKAEDNLEECSQDSERKNKGMADF